MKSATFSFFRMAEQKMLDKAGFQFEPYEFRYRTETKEREIKRSRKSETFSIEVPSEDCDWDPNVNDIIISRRCTVKKPEVLFREKDGGVGFEDAELGLAVIISSVPSSRRIVIPYEGPICNSDSPTQLEFTARLPPKTYRGQFSLTTILYLRSPSSDDPPSYYCNTPGSKLGVLEPTTDVYIDEQSPEFPTRIHGEGRNNPLWRLSITWTNPLTDDFMKSVCLILNEDNPEFSSLKLNSDHKNKGMLSEIYSSAILQIIYRVKNESDSIWNETISGDASKIREGSVSDYVYYMMTQRFNCDVTDIVTLSERIRKTIYGGL